MPLDKSGAKFLKRLIQQTTSLLKERTTLLRAPGAIPGVLLPLLVLLLQLLLLLLDLLEDYL